MDFSNDFCKIRQNCMDSVKTEYVRQLVRTLTVALAMGSLANASVHLYHAGNGNAPLMLKGQTGKLSWQEQGAGSLTTAVEGWLLVDFDGTSIQFMPGSQITFSQTNLCQPGRHGLSDKKPSAFGGKFTDGSGPFARREFFAVRNLTLNLTSERIPVTKGDLNYFATRFDSSKIRFTVPPGFNARLDHFYSGLVLSEGSLPLEGKAISNDSGLGGQPAVGIPEIESWRMPLDLSLVVPGTFGGETKMELMGEIGFGLNLIDPWALVVLINYPAIPDRVTLIWDPQLHLLRSPSLRLPKWTAVDVQPPLDIQLNDAAGFYQTTY